MFVIPKRDESAFIYKFTQFERKLKPLIQTNKLIICSREHEVAKTTCVENKSL